MVYDEKLQIIKYNADNKDDIDKKIPNVAARNGKTADWTGAKFMTVMKAMSNNGYFIEIIQWEQVLLETCELYNHLNDYVDLSNSEELCCNPESIGIKKSTNWFRIYYADYETDATVSPHKPYLYCVCTDDIFKDQ